MARLALMRHAKSSWADPGLDDFDRPLNHRGQEAAAAMGRYLCENGIVLEIVLCSPALRTRQTLDIVAAEAGRFGQVQYPMSLYHQSGGLYLGLLAEIDSSIESVMVLGHNPATQATALMLTRPDNQHYDSIRGKFPTGALCLFESADPICELNPNNATLKDFVTPRSLGER